LARRLLPGRPRPPGGCGAPAAHRCAGVGPRARAGDHASRLPGRVLPPESVRRPADPPSRLRAALDLRGEPRRADHRARRTLGLGAPPRARALPEPGHAARPVAPLRADGGLRGPGALRRPRAPSGAAGRVPRVGRRLAAVLAAPPRRALGDVARALARRAPSPVGDRAPPVRDLDRAGRGAGGGGGRGRRGGRRGVGRQAPPPAGPRPPGAGPAGGARLLPPPRGRRPRGPPPPPPPASTAPPSPPRPSLSA